MPSKLSERVLKKWRKEALIDIDSNELKNDTDIIDSYTQKRILQLTQELLDNHLVNQK